MQKSKKRILLAIQSQYSGHLARGLVYNECLQNDFEIELVTAGGPPAPWFPAAYGRPFKSYPGLYMVENKKGGIAQFKTAGHYLRGIPSMLKSRRGIARYLKEQQFDLVVSDFEPEFSRICLKIGQPVLTVDAHRRLYLKNCPSPSISGASQRWDNFCMRVGINFMLAWGNRSIAVSFFDIRLDDDESSVVVSPPLLRSGVLELESRRGDFLLIYHNNGGARDDIVDQCRRHGIPAVVYGYRPAGGAAEEQEGPVTFKAMSADTFLQDLAACRAYASRAGFESVAEALYLGKPTFLVPQSGQFEQNFNAFHASSIGAVVSNHFDYKAAYENNAPFNGDREWLKSGRDLFRMTVDEMLAG